MNEPDMEPTVLTISMDDKGIKVEGPITNKMLCYAMLECARDAVKDASKMPEPKIQPAAPGDVLALTRRQ